MKKEDVLKTIEKFKKSDKQASFSEIIAELCKDKLIEIYFGDVYEQANLSDFSQNIYSVICGKIISGYGDCLFIDCYYADDETKQLKRGNIVIVNGFNVKAITEIDTTGRVKDIIISTKTTNRIKKYE